MASSYTSRIRLTKQADGENPNTWGTILNNQVIDLVDDAIASYSTISIGSAATVTLTENEGAIIIRDEGIPEIYAPIGTGDHCDNIRFTLAFLLYAVEKDEWIKEFSDFVGSIKDKHSNLSADLRRLQFEVIDGSKE